MSCVNVILKVATKSDPEFTQKHLVAMTHGYLKKMKTPDTFKNRQQKSLKNKKKSLEYLNIT